jgi:hypothetical protein
MAHTIAIIGSGPAGFYAAEGIAKARPDARVDIFDRLPTPYGLVRSGVAPDHQGTKNVWRVFQRTAHRDNVRFLGNVEMGRDISLAELREAYDAVVLAIGAPVDRELGVPGEHQRGVIGSHPFTSWYNGHPDWSGFDPDLDTSHIAIIGNGNVAVDVARVLGRTPPEMVKTDLPQYASERISRAPLTDIYMIGRRGPGEASFTPVELRELGDLARTVAVVDGSQLPESIAAKDPKDQKLKDKILEILRGYSQNDPQSKPVRLHIMFYAAPQEVLGDGDKVTGLRLMKTKVEGGRAVATGETFDLPVGVIVKGDRLLLPADRGAADAREFHVLPEHRRARGRQPVGGRLGQARPERRHRDEPRRQPRGGRSPAEVAARDGEERRARARRRAARRAQGARRDVRGLGEDREARARGRAGGRAAREADRVAAPARVRRVRVSGRALALAACAAIAAGCNPSTIDLGPIDRPDAFVPRRDAGGPHDAGEQDAASPPRDAGDPPDAWTPPDAGPPDAGRVCGRNGECHPLYDASCRCGYSSMTYDWACGRSGSRGLGASCDLRSDCGAGLLCARQASAARGQCRRLCDEDSDCGAGEGCARIDTIVISCAGYCLPLDECSLVAQDCGSGRGCYWLRDETAGGREHVFCNRAGTAAEDELCFDDPTACVPGTLCAARLDGLTYGHRCRGLCASDDSCEVGDRCVGTTADGARFCR